MFKISFTSPSHTLTLKNSKVQKFNNIYIYIYRERERERERDESK